MIVDCSTTHFVMDCTVDTQSGALQIWWERSWVPHPRLVLDGAEDVINGDVKRSEVGINSVDFRRIS